MEKRKVRIYRAQEGGQPSIDELGYQGASQQPEQQQEQMTEESVMQMIYQDLSNDMPIEGVINKLVNAVGMDITTAQKYIDAVVVAMQQEEEAAEEDEEEDPDQEPAGGEPIPQVMEEDEEESPVNSYADLALEDDLTEEDLAIENGSEMFEQFSMGGFKTRKGYVNSVLGNVMKQFGGNTKSISEDTDFTGQDLRKERLNAFIGSIKKEGNTTIAKEEAQKQFDNARMQYDQMMSFAQMGGQNITQNDIDDVYSKDVSDPYMPEAQRGGNWRNYFENVFPANVVPRYRNQYLGAYDSEGNALAKPFGENTKFKNIVVNDRGIFGRPKSYTINFTNPEMDPRKQNLITLPGTGTTPAPTPVPDEDPFTYDLSNKAKRAIKKGERKVERNYKRIARSPQGFNNPPIITNTPFAQGGDLSKFIPQAQTGAQSPIVYTNNPALAGMSSASMVNAAAPANAVNMAGLSGGTNLSWNTPGMVNQTNAQGVVTGSPVNAGFTGQQPIQSQIQIAPSQTGSHQINKTYAPPGGDFGMKFKTDKINDPEAWLNTFNAGVSGVTGLINRRDRNMDELRMMNNLTADNMFASDPSLDRGDYDTNSGLFRPDESGQMHNSRSKQYGGSMEDYTEGDEIYMTDDELSNFLENGGEVEYI